MRWFDRTSLMSLAVPIVVLIYHTGRLAERVTQLEHTMHELKEELRAIVRWRENRGGRS